MFISKFEHVMAKISDSAKALKFAIDEETEIVKILAPSLGKIILFRILIVSSSMAVIIASENLLSMAMNSPDQLDNQLPAHQHAIKAAKYMEQVTAIISKYEVNTDPNFLSQIIPHTELRVTSTRTVDCNLQREINLYNE